MKILQVNVVCNSGSTGRIAEEIGLLAQSSGFNSYIAFGRGDRPSKSIKIKTSSKVDFYLHAIQTRLFDNHGLCSVNSTIKLIDRIIQIKPDIIHLHNIHGYYLNYKLLFRFLKTLKIPIVWTLHDCWPFTGHCAHFEFVGCHKWKTGCFSCVQKREYPSSIFKDNSKFNYNQKKNSFLGVENLTIISVSKWLDIHLQNSFLSNYSRKLIYNGVDLSIFKPKNKDSIEQFRVLGVSGVWTEKKGLTDFYLLKQMLGEDVQIILVGLSKKQILKLPKGIIGIERTESVHKLADLYSNSDVFINTTYEDTFPTVNIESLACGTPVITYNTGGSPEAVNSDTGFVVAKGDIHGLIECINIVKKKGKIFYSNACRERAVKYFNKDDRFDEYIQIYQKLLKQ